MVKKSSEDHRGNPENLVPQFAELTHALSGVDLPQDLDGLRDQAEENGADDEILALLDRMPDREYHTMADVIAGAAEVVDGKPSVH
jgi:hypothetical protein